MDKIQFDALLKEIKVGLEAKKAEMQDVLIKERSKGISTKTDKILDVITDFEFQRDFTPQKESIAVCYLGNPEVTLTYILDSSPEKTHVVDFMKRITGYDSYDSSVHPYVNDRPVGERVVPALEQWLAAFVDAEFVVTDSFHGCVLSLLLHKRFIAVGNSRRGMARLNSLLDMFGLDMRLVHGIDPEDDGVYFLSDIDWEEVDRIIARKREESLTFLRECLEK